MNIETTEESPAKKSSIFEHGVRYWQCLTNQQRALLVINLLAIGLCIFHVGLISWELQKGIYLAIRHWPVYEINVLEYLITYLPFIFLFYFLASKKISLIKPRSSLIILVLSLAPLILSSLYLFITFFILLKTATGK